MIEITAAAATEILRIQRDQTLPEDAALRLFVKGGGCSGMSYGMEFEKVPRENDRVFDVEGVTVFMDPPRPA